MVVVDRLAPSDRAAWEALFHGYLEFYRRTAAAEMYDRAWVAFQEDSRMHAYGARFDRELVGIAHYLFHANTSGADVCYLQDLFTAPGCRGRGVATALIAAVTDQARDRGCGRVYWMTHETNDVARRLYDRVAMNRGFIRYEIDL